MPKVTLVVGPLLLVASSSFAQTPQGNYRTFRPSGPGPHAAVALLSGCDGFTPSVSPALYERLLIARRSRRWDGRLAGARF